MSTQFDLEQNIIQCWCILDDIKLINERIINISPWENRLELTDALSSVASLYDIKFNKLFSTFEKFLKEIHESKVCDNSEVLRQTESVTISGY